MRVLRLKNGVNEIGPTRRLILSVIPFLLLVGGYAFTSYSRHLENPEDNIVPGFSAMKTGFVSALIDMDRIGQYAIDITVPTLRFDPNRNTNFESRGLKINFESYSMRLQFGGLLITDTLATGKRFLISLSIILIGIFWGLHMGLFEDIEAFSSNFLTFFNFIPAPVLLPILFIYFGIDDGFKTALVVSGVLPSITLDTYLRAKETPNEQLVTGFTLGATDAEVAYRIVLPQILPRVLDTIRLNFKSIAILLIFGEAVASTAGLGYRILVLRRTMAMDTIIPYCIVTTILLFSIDLIVRFWIKKRYPWLRNGR